MSDLRQMSCKRSLRVVHRRLEVLSGAAGVDRPSSALRCLVSSNRRAFSSLRSGCRGVVSGRTSPSEGAFAIQVLRDDAVDPMPPTTSARRVACGLALDATG
jgi:hypothetical protein